MAQPCSGFAAISGARKAGAFVPFADPAANALEADVFWRADTYARILSAYARDRDSPGLGAVISLAGASCRKTLLKTVDGEQHILLKTDRDVVQLRCLGEDIRAAPFALELIMDCFPETEGAHRLMRRLAGMFRGGAGDGKETGWSVEAMRHRDALAALDLRADGKSYREIALFLYGEDAVARDWNDPGQTMKNRLIRSVKRGARMRGGGYRALLS
ncbi:DNA -binding domain-containing protein [Hyphococcus sp.]|uniref:DNA -binding domain-containing protein n=1 Tax=Hyphococcus sp. TaxID=2038636 RepID=UPI0035C6D72F